MSTLIKDRTAEDIVILQKNPMGRVSCKQIQDMTGDLLSHLLNGEDVPAEKLQAAMSLAAAAKLQG